MSDNENQSNAEDNEDFLDAPPVETFVRRRNWYQRNLAPMIMVILFSAIISALIFFSSPSITIGEGNIENLQSGVDLQQNVINLLSIVSLVLIVILVAVKKIRWAWRVLIFQIGFLLGSFSGIMALAQSISG